MRGLRDLREPEARAAYERDLRRRKPWPSPAPPRLAPLLPPGETPPPLSLEESVAAAEELIRDGRHWEAVAQLEPALEKARVRSASAPSSPSPEVVVKNPQWVKRAESYLQEAVHADSYADRGLPPPRRHLRAGQLRRRGPPAMYRKALDQQPDNRHARRELARLRG